MAGDGGKSSKKDKKRKSGQNQAYKAEFRREKSHVRRIKKHMKRYGVCPVSEAALIRFATAAGTRVYGSATEFLKQIKKAA